MKPELIHREPPPAPKLIRKGTGGIVVGKASERASAAFDAAIAKGLTVTFSGVDGFTATIALDSETQTQIADIKNDLAGGIGFPGGAASFQYPDISGAPQTFTQVQFTALYKAMRDYVFALRNAQATQTAGAPASWPEPSVTVQP